MNEFFEAMLDVFLMPLDILYGQRWVAPFVILPIMFFAAFLVRRQATRRVLPYLDAARERINVLQSALGSDTDPVLERQLFAEKYIDISAAMSEDSPSAHGLKLAWREFQESMVDESDAPIRNTSRPGIFFSRAAPKLNDLTFASNIFVAAGLILTFLGLIVALNTASQNMGQDISAAKLSLENLLTVAGACCALISSFSTS